METEGAGPKGTSASGGSERWKKYVFPVSLGLVFVLFILVRLQGFSAILNWDEGRSIIILRAMASGDPGALYHEGIYVHPPLFLLLCRYGTSIMGESATLYRLINLTFASGSFFVLFFLVREINSRTTALFACLALALLPAASSTNIWIKEDTICVFWMLCALYAFVRRRYVLSGILLGLSLLSKENGIMLLMVLPCYLLLVRGGKNEWRGLLITAGFAALVCGWWYIFFSETKGSWLGFFAGSTQNSKDWAQPWHYYFSGTVVDLGWPLLLLSVWGCIDSIRSFFKGKDRRVILPVVWVAVCYLFLSISRGKPYWMITVALPAWGWLAGMGLKGLLDFFRPRGRALAYFVLAAALVAMFGVNYHNGGAQYAKERCFPYYRLSSHSYNAAQAINSEVGEGASLMLWPNSNPNPPLLYYLRSDIHYVIPTAEDINEERVGDLLGLWSGEGVEIGYFNTDEWGKWLAEIYRYYLGGSIGRNVYFYVYEPEDREGGGDPMPHPPEQHY